MRNVETLLALAYYRAEDAHQLRSLLHQYLSSSLLLVIAANVNQPKPVSTLFGVFSGYPYAHQEILLAQSLICLDVVGPDRTGRPDELFAVLDIPCRSLQSFHKLADLPCESKCPILKIVPFGILTFGHLNLFRISGFDIRASYRYCLGSVSLPSTALAATVAGLAR